jgi:hypothetical protein
MLTTAGFRHESQLPGKPLSAPDCEFQDGKVFQEAGNAICNN